MFRLAHKPCVWMCMTGRVLFLLVAVAAVLVVQHRVYMITLASILVAGALVDLLVFAIRTRHGAPVVEMDRKSLGYGDSAKVRISGAQRVELVGDCNVTSVADFTEYRDTKTARTRCYEEELFRGSSEEPVMVQLQLPKSPPGDAMRWTLVVNSEHHYPLRVV